ncbi:hypothetical protein PENCOP_c011G07775 [Penicillium coprophilum]|uniref:Uncharacterized protein n=1 Tax=Penicillium coprophilum TaxID=36646 RepID=A0A1V6UF10_9EURO|nr:hypothetical protein PENCOP_c011G07775 [Penicillium coprophilum]
MVVGGSDVQSNTGTRTATTTSSASEVSETSSDTLDSISKGTSPNTDAAPIATSENYAPPTPVPLVLVGGLLADSSKATKIRQLNENNSVGIELLLLRPLERDVKL